VSFERVGVHIIASLILPPFNDITNCNFRVLQLDTVEAQFRAVFLFAEDCSSFSSICCLDGTFFLFLGNMIDTVCKEFPICKTHAMFLEIEFHRAREGIRMRTVSWPWEPQIANRHKPLARFPKFGRVWIREGFAVHTFEEEKDVYGT
jgi:hypothetical protein